MTKLALTLAATGLAAGLVAIPSAGLAQNDTVNEIVVYGNDPCPRSTDDEVVVCARKPETERYRIPEKYRSTGPRQTRQAWANKARDVRDRQRDRNQQLLAGWAGRLHRLPDPGHQPGTPRGERGARPG